MEQELTGNHVFQVLSFLLSSSSYCFSLIFSFPRLSLPLPLLSLSYFSLVVSFCFCFSSLFTFIHYLHFILSPPVVPHPFSSSHPALLSVPHFVVSSLYLYLLRLHLNVLLLLLPITIHPPIIIQLFPPIAPRHLFLSHYFFPVHSMGRRPRHAPPLPHRFPPAHWSLSTHNSHRPLEKEGAAGARHGVGAAITPPTLQYSHTTVSTTCDASPASSL